MTLRKSRFNRNVARSAKEVAATGDIYPDNLKAMWNGIDPKIPRQLIFCGNLGFARFSAPRASQDFNPALAGHPPTGALQSRLFHSGRPPRSKRHLAIYAKAAKVSLDGLCPLRFVGGFAASSGARTRWPLLDAVTRCVSSVPGQRFPTSSICDWR